LRPFIETLEEHGEGLDMVSAVRGLMTSKTYRGTLAAALMRRFKRRGERSDTCLESDEEISRCDFSQLRGLWLLQCRLAWYGFRSVKVGQSRELSEHTLLVDLLHTCGTLLCRVEIDRQSGAIRRPASHALVRLLASLGQATTGHGSLMAEPMAN
jgi:hypothetical protein